MAIPLAPVAGLALRYAAVAGIAYLAARRMERGRLSQPVEDLAARRDANQVNATGRFRRVIRFGHAGPGLSIDATILGRLKMERV